MASRRREGPAGGIRSRSLAVRRSGRAFPAALLAAVLVTAAAAGCGSRDGVARVDAAGQRLGALMASAVGAMAREDPVVLRACRDDLVRLRLETTAAAVSGSAGELRDTLVVAIDAVAAALDATARGLQRQAEAESAQDLGAGDQTLRQATADLERGQACLETALATAQRFSEMRRRLGSAR